MSWCAKSLHHLRRALRYQPTLKKAHALVADVYQNMKKCKEAMKFYGYALQLGSKDPKVHFNAGRCARKMGQEKRAIYHFKSSLKYKPDFEPARQALQKVTKKSARG